MNNNKKTKKEHYVPQFYLSQFVGNDNKLTIYNFRIRKLFEMQPNNFACENYLYETKLLDVNPELGKYFLENHIEKIFCNYEGEFAELLRVIIRVCIANQNPNALILRKEEKKLLYRFVVNMIVRHPDNMQILGLNTISDDMKKSDEIRFLQEMSNEMGIGGIEPFVIAAQKKAFLTEEIANSFPEQCINEIKTLPFIFFYAKKGEFITSDSPVCLGDDPIILEKNQTSIYFPLSPKVAVIFGEYKQFKNKSNRMIIITEDFVDEFNKKFMLKCKEYGKSIIGRNVKQLIMI